MSRGLKQGDLLVPFLFLVVAKGLSGLMRMAHMGGLFSEYKVGENNVEVSLMQFVDDNLFFVEPLVQNVMCIKATLRCFEMASGLEMNFHKGRLIGVMVDIGSLRTFVSLLNCGIMEIPLIYFWVSLLVLIQEEKLLGVLLSIKSKSRLLMWSSKSLSLRGRVTLLTQCYPPSSPFFFFLF